MRGLRVRSEFLWLTVVSVTILSLPGATAHGEEQWVGKRVMLKRGVALKVGSQIVPEKEPELDPVQLGSAENWTRNRYRPYLVKQVNGPWLWVVPKAPKFGGGTGWVKAGDVLRREQVDDYFTAQIRIKPTPEDYLDRGYFREKNDPDLAIADYSEAIRLDPTFAAAYYYRGVAWRAKEKYGDAIADYTELIRLKPDRFVAYFSRGITWSLREEYDKAIVDYTEAIRLFPECISALINRGICRTEKTEYDQAIDDFNEALQLNPKSANAHIARATAWRFKKDYDRAIADYSEAIRLDVREKRHAYYYRAFMYDFKEDYDKAITDYNEAIRLDPEFTSALINRGICRGKSTEYDQAIDDFNHALRLNPKSARAYLARATAWKFKEDYDRAIADYSEAIRLDSSEKSQAYHDRSAMYYAKEQYDKSIADLNQVISLDAKCARAFSDRAWILASCPEEKVRNGEKALESAIQACELTKWANAEYLSALAAAHAEEGDFESAVKWQQIANSSSPRDSAASARFGTQLLNLYKSKKPYRFPRKVKVRTTLFWREGKWCQVA